MKNISKTIASISLSLLAIGVTAQVPASFQHFDRTLPIPAKALPSSFKHLTNKKVSATPQTYLLDNLGGDQTITLNINPSAMFYGGFSNLFFVNVNSALTIVDSGANYALQNNSITTVFDTAYDDISATFPGDLASASVDSIIVFVHYHNTSGLNDTVFLSVNSVTAAGFPGVTVYGVDTVVITPTFFANNNIDSTQGFIARKHIVIPGTARNGWNFGVQYTVHAPKTMDTVGMAFYFQGINNCAGLGGSYVPEPSACGVPCGALTSINTFQEGNWWFTKKGNLGNNTSLSWPITAAGPSMGFYENAGTEYWAPLSAALLSCCTGCAGDTLQYDVQDLAITPYVNAINVTGINKINNNGLSVGQNYPNPFNKQTQISYSLTKSSDVNFTICDMTGRVIMTNSLNQIAPGKHVITLSANTFSPGIYFYTFDVNGSKVTKKMVITE
jgi:hypothetical protein